MDALAFIDKDGKAKRQPFYVVSGDEDFLRRHVHALLEPLILGDADPEFCLTAFPGDKTDFSTVRNELDSGSFFGDRRMVVVEQADAFVTKFRPQLEAHAAAPAGKGVLVLDVKAFPATTKLAKAVPDAAHLVCKAPPDHRLPIWAANWCKDKLGKTIPASAAQMLVELVGPAMGVIDQELRKLADYVGDRSAIAEKDVDELTGRSRGANVFKILDAVGDGRPAVALGILAELFDAGEDPLKILGALGFQLRRLAKSARLNAQGVPIADALAKVGIAPYFRGAADKQLRHLGRQRLDLLFDWLLELDGGMKGGNPLPPRVQMERFVVRLARARA